jgi:predicted O-methyltransferase YrrM
VADFIIARGARRVLETGSFMGATTVHIVDALHRLGGGEFTFCEVDSYRMAVTFDRVVRFEMTLENPGKVRVGSAWDAIEYLSKPGNTGFDLCFVDDCHEKPHVTKELMLLIPKMNPGGLILLHDVFGVCDLQDVVGKFGGYSIDLPRLGPAGGLGVIQVR